MYSVQIDLYSHQYNIYMYSVKMYLYSISTISTIYINIYVYIHMYSVKMYLYSHQYKSRVFLPAQVYCSCTTLPTQEFPGVLRYLSVSCRQVSKIKFRSEKFLWEKSRIFISKEDKINYNLFERLRFVLATGSLGLF